jgi:hypothetical protein
MRKCRDTESFKGCGFSKPDNEFRVIRTNKTTGKSYREKLCNECRKKNRRTGKREAMHQKPAEVRLYEEKLCLKCDLNKCDQSHGGGCYVNGKDRHFNREVYAKLGHGITQDMIDKTFFSQKTENILKVFIHSGLAEKRNDLICLK